MITKAAYHSSSSSSSSSSSHSDDDQNGIYTCAFKLKHKAPLIRSLRGCYIIADALDRDTQQQRSAGDSTNSNASQPIVTSIYTTRKKPVCKCYLTFKVATILPIPKYFEKKITDFCVDIATGM
jgi:hypothetical protein